ncbi:MAG: rod shape-determining protein MreD [Rhodobacterales bacterium]|jgi:rod shape-determining protein MreD|nr:rod shape-determining protein MreD [Rhodobacterales bacterium]
MAEAASARIWSKRLTFGLIAFGIVFMQLLPLNTVPMLWAMPDLLLVFTMVWVARRPDFVPVLVIAIVFLMADLLFQRPPGLMTAMVVLATETVRARAIRLRNAPFSLEWFTVALAIAGITVGNRLVLAVVMTPQAPLGLTLIQMLMTILAYPLIVALAHLVFGVSRPAPGEVNALGQRL